MEVLPPAMGLDCQVRYWVGRRAHGHRPHLLGAPGMRRIVARSRPLLEWLDHGGRPKASIEWARRLCSCRGDALGPGGSPDRAISPRFRSTGVRPTIP